MNDEEKQKFLTKEQDVPPELIKELSSDGGVEGVKLLLEGQGWDKQAPTATMIHSLGAGGNIVGSRWLLLVSCCLKILKTFSFSLISNAGEDGTSGSQSNQYLAEVP